MKIFKALSLYTFTTFFNKGAAILLLPFLTVHLSPEDYGIASLYSTVVLFSQYLISFGTTSILNVSYFKNSRSAFDIEIIKTWASCFYLTLILTGFVAIFQKPLSHFLGVNPIWLYFIPLCAYATYIVETQFNILRNAEDSKQYSKLSIGQTIVELSLVAVFILLVHLKWQGRILANLLVVFLFAGIAIYKILKDSNIRLPNINEFRTIIFAGSAYILDGFTTYSLNNSNRYVINHYLQDKSIVGLLSVAASVGGLMLLVINSLYAGVIPILYKQLVLIDSKVKYVSTIIVYYCFILLIALAFIYLFIIIIFPLLINRRFHESFSYVPYFLFGYFFWGMNVLFKDILIFMSKKKVVFINSIISLILNIILSLILVHYYSKLGVLWAFILSYFFTFLLNFSVFQYYYNIKYYNVYSFREIKKLIS